MVKKILLSLILVALVAVVIGCTQTTAPSQGTSQIVNAGAIPPASQNPAPASPEPVKTEPAPVTPPAPAAPEPPKATSQILKVATLMSNVNDYKGKLVVLQGKITSVCGGNGCWFIMNDGTGSLYVDLAPSNLTIPQSKMGATVKVSGELAKRGSDYYLVGKKVEF